MGTTKYFEVKVSSLLNHADVTAFGRLVSILTCVRNSRVIFRVAKQFCLFRGLCVQRQIGGASQKIEPPLTNQAHLTLDFDSSSAKKNAMDPLKGAALVICAISLCKTASTKRKFTTQLR